MHMSSLPYSKVSLLLNVGFLNICSYFFLYNIIALEKRTISVRVHFFHINAALNFHVSQQLAILAKLSCQLQT